MSNQKGDIGTAVMVFGIIGFIILAIWASIHWSTNYHDVTFTVNKSERVVTKDTSKYLVYTDNGVYENTDSLWNNKWNSSDLYNTITAGKKYTCTVVGYRNGFFSAYENLISCEEV